MSPSMVMLEYKVVCVVHLVRRSNSTLHLTQSPRAPCFFFLMYLLVTLWEDDLPDLLEVTSSNTSRMCTGKLYTHLDGI